MFNHDDLQQRKIPVSLDGVHFLTTRSANVVSGATQTIYQGFAYPGSSEAANVWMVKRTTVAEDGSTTTLFAGGQALFNQVWANRTSLSYT